MARLVQTSVLAAAMLVLAAAPAGADPAGPSDFRSEVIALVPESDAVRAEVRGGDSFLELSVEGDHTVVVFGYTDGEDGDGRGNDPYLRFNPDGTVERNRRSSATYLNEDRRGDVAVPADTADPTAEPEWEQVADDGTYAWHDHRIHWMLDDPPEGTARGERVGGEYDPWVVPITIDGQAVEIRGVLTYEDGVSPLPWVLVAVLGGAALAWFGGRATPVAVAAGALTLVAALAVVVGRAEASATPGNAGANPLVWALPVAALAAGVAALVLWQRAVGVVLALGSVAALAGWALLRLGVLLKPVLPSDLAPGIDRLSVALALGVAAGAAYLSVTSSTLTLPPLEDDEPESPPTASRPT